MMWGLAPEIDAGSQSTIAYFFLLYKQGRGSHLLHILLRPFRWGLIVTAQLQPNTKLVWPHNAVEPTTTIPPTQTLKALAGNPGRWFLVYNLILTRWNMEEDLNIFENGRLPQSCSRQHMELKFGMQYWFNPTRWFLFFLNGRRPQLFENERQPYLFLNWRLPQIFWK
jgi:hypothetical protein